MTVPCPSCNTEGCVFDRAHGDIRSRIYDESPKTKGLLARLSLRSGNNGPVKDSLSGRFATAQSTPRSLVRHRSDPARKDFAIMSPTYMPSPRPTSTFGLDPLNLKRIQSIPEHSNVHIIHYIGEGGNTTDMNSISPSYSSPPPPALRQPTIFSFASSVPVAAS